MDKLYLGVARESITPVVGGCLYGYAPDVFSESVADDLTATAFYFHQGDVQALMVNLTVCEIHTMLCDRIRGMIAKCCGIPSACCLLCATHTHSAPNVAGGIGWGDLDMPYIEDIFIPAILKVAAEAMTTVRPVTMAVACGNSMVGVNRREVNGDNRVVFGQNPWAPYDPRMTIVSFADEHGVTVANMIHYGAHGTAAGMNHEITRDWSGVMVDALEAHSGAVTAFFNGTVGDSGPRISNGQTVGDLSFVRELGAVAAADAQRIFDTLPAPQAVTLVVSEREIALPLKPRMSEADARRMWEEYKDACVNADGMIRAHLEDTVRSYEEGACDLAVRGFSQTVIALGDVMFAAFPYELFAEIGLRMQRECKGFVVLPLSITNGDESYFVTQDTLCRGGYEVEMFCYRHRQPFCDDADFHLIKNTVAHLRDVIAQKEE